MIMEIPFKFTVGGRKEGNSINSWSARWDVAQLDIPETTDEDAPIAVEWFDEDHFPRRRPRREHRPVASDGMDHTRYHDGRHWLPVITETLVPGRGNERLSARRFAEFLSAGECAAPFTILPNSKRGEGNPYGGFETIIGSDRELLIGEITAAAADLLVVDGMLYAKASEPRVVLALETFDRTADGRVTGAYGTFVSIIADKDFVLPAAHEMFPIERFDAALNSARKRNATDRSRDEYHALNLKRRPLFGEHRPADMFASHVGLVETYARTFVNSFEKLAPATIPAAAVRGYADMRDSLDLFPGEDGVEAAEAAALHLIAVLEGMKAGLKRQPEDHAHCLKFLRALAATAEARPIEMPGLETGRTYHAPK